MTVQISFTSGALTGVSEFTAQPSGEWSEDYRIGYRLGQELFAAVSEGVLDGLKCALEGLEQKI